MKITFYGHASLGIEVVETHFVDPYICKSKAAHINIDDLQANYILTHAHGDHILDVGHSEKNKQ
jgi:L-ascorbate metabolism protein UlaG (beta-lactamase superfamily)